MKLVDYQIGIGNSYPEYPDITGVFTNSSSECHDFPLLLESSVIPMPGFDSAPEVLQKQQIGEPDDDVLLLEFPEIVYYLGENRNAAHTMQELQENYVDRDEVSVETPLFEAADPVTESTAREAVMDRSRVQPEAGLAEALSPRRAFTALSLFAMRLGGTGENPEWKDSPRDGSVPKFVDTQGWLKSIGNRPRKEMRGVTANAMSLLQTAVDTSYVAHEVLDYPGLAQHLYGVLAEIETAARSAGVHLTQSHSRLQGRECAEQSLLGGNAQERLVRLARVAAIGNLLSGHVIPVQNSEEKPFNSDPSVRNKIVVTSPEQD